MTTPLLEVPVIDISPYYGDNADAKRRLAAEVDRACRDIGFLVIAGHGVDPALIERVDRLSRAFFDLPLEEKLKVRQPASDVTRGYTPIASEALARSQGDYGTEGDLNESFMIGPVDVGDDPYYTAPAAGKHFHPNLWPERPEGLREAYEAYFRAMSALARDIMRIFALALGLEETFFDAKIDRHISRLRVRNYPAPAQPPKPGQLRAGAHADYGSLTILKTEASSGGLQVFNKNGEWVDVPIVPGTYIINLGELLARWTNDRWVATLHRVVAPPVDKLAGSRRQSLVFFHNPNYDAEIACIPTCRSADQPAKYPPTTSGEHLRRQFVRTQAA